jgi:succinyl-CoA synthetase beta subunit
MPCSKVMLVERMYMRREMYISIMLDRGAGGPIFIASPAGIIIFLIINNIIVNIVIIIMIFIIIYFFLIIIINVTIILIITIFIASPAGGTSIEDVAEATPELIFKQPINIMEGVTDTQCKYLIRTYVCIFI